MEINEALYSYLTNYAGFTALVSNRIYPDILPQNVTFPAVTYQQISATRQHLFQQDADLVEKRYQFSVYGTTRNSAKSVSKQIRLALQNYNGTMGGVGGVVVNAVEMDAEEDTYEPDVSLYSTKMDFLIWQRE